MQCQNAAPKNAKCKRNVGLDLTGERSLYARPWDLRALVAKWELDHIEYAARAAVVDVQPIDEI